MLPRTLLPALLLATSASAATISIDDFGASASATATSAVGPEYSSIDYTSVANGATRAIWTQSGAAGTSTVSVANNTITQTADVPAYSEINYSYSPSISLIPAGGTIADSIVSIWVANNTSGTTAFSMTFANTAGELNLSWNFSLGAGTSGLQTVRLADLGASFPWSQVDRVTLSCNTTAAGTVTFGGDGNGLRIATAQPVPEPSTYGIALGALALAAAAIRRRRKQASK